MDIPYTICFIKKEDSILLLLRKKNPNKGKWNGVGGKLAENETPYKCALRETWEETGLVIKDLTFRGIVSWNQIGGMYVYVGTDMEGSVQEGPEGKLEWKTWDWINESSNAVSNMRHFLPKVFSKDIPVEHAFTYSPSGEIIDYKIKNLSSETLYSAQIKEEKILNR